MMYNTQFYLSNRREIDNQIQRRVFFNFNMSIRDDLRIDFEHEHETWLKIYFV